MLMILMILGCAFAQEKTDLLKLKKSDPLPTNIFVEISKAVNPAVVNINTTQLPHQMMGRRRGLGPQDPFSEMLEQLGGQSPQQRPTQSLGTGFIIRADGLIVTNNHVIDQADVIKVQLEEGSKDLIDAEVIGKDDKTDIALLRIKTKKHLTVARLGVSSELEVGEWVTAFGNPYGHGHTMTKGIVSALNREINEINISPFIQTDASINRGNSGGPLVNIRGEVIGVNTAIDERGPGLGFAIPIDVVKSILPQLEKNGIVQRGYIGIAMLDLDEQYAESANMVQQEGALVVDVGPHSPAETAGIKNHDLIVEFNGKPVTSRNDMSRYVLNTPVGETVNLKVIRGGKPLSLKVQVAKKDDERKAFVSKVKTPKGIKAPNSYGFSAVEYSKALVDEMGLPGLSEPRPIISEVEIHSPAAKAGLAPGDIILDVNRKAVSKPQDVFQLLKPGTINILRVLKQEHPFLIYLK